MTQTLETIIETMTQLDGWEDRYAYVIDLGRQLKPYPPAFQDDAHLVPGCTSRVWMHHQWIEGKLALSLDSDAHIVKGLLAVLAAVYDRRDAASILTYDIEDLFRTLGLEGQLSPNRRNGFFAVAAKIKALAAAAAEPPGG